MLRKTLLAGALATLVWAPLARADTLPVAADSQVNLTAVAARGGALTTVTVKNSLPGASYRAFAQFDLTALPPGLPVTKATLRMWANLVTTAGDVEIAAVLAPWQEGTLTAITAPALSATLTDFSVTKAQQKTYVNADVTEIVKDWVSGALVNHGLALLGGTTLVNVRFDSKESLQTSHPMELEVSLGLPPGSGDITAIVPGFGLSGGGNIGDVVLAVNQNVIQRRLTGSCAVGSSIRSIDVNGVVTCQTDSGILQVLATSGLANQSPAATMSFIGPTVVLTITSGQKIVMNASKGLGSTAVGGASGLKLYACNKSTAVGSTIASQGGGIWSLRVAQNTQQTFSMNWAYTSLAAGSWEVGMCGSASAPANWNSNDYGYITAFVTN